MYIKSNDIYKIKQKTHKDTFLHNLRVNEETNNTILVDNDIYIKYQINKKQLENYLLSIGFKMIIDLELFKYVQVIELMNEFIKAKSYLLDQSIEGTFIYSDFYLGKKIINEIFKDQNVFNLATTDPASLASSILKQHFNTNSKIFYLTTDLMEAIDKRNKNYQTYFTDTICFKELIEGVNLEEYTNKLNDDSINDQLYIYPFTYQEEDNYSFNIYLQTLYEIMNPKSKEIFKLLKDNIYIDHSSEVIKLKTKSYQFNILFLYDEFVINKDIDVSKYDIIIYTNKTYLNKQLKGLLKDPSINYLYRHFLIYPNNRS